MPGTRSSARIAEKSADENSTPPSASSKNGTKRKAEVSSSPSSTKAKRGKASAHKEQKTLEETLPDDKEVAKELNAEEKGKDDDSKGEATGDDQKHHTGADDVDMKDLTATNGHGEAHDGREVKKFDEKLDAASIEDKSASTENGTAPEQEKSQDLKSDANGDKGGNALEKVKASENDDGKTHKAEPEPSASAETNKAGTEEAIETDKQREAAMPSNILEKGVIYFFTRGRVGVDGPDSVQDLARSYFVLRPLPAGGKITDGAIQDMENNRLMALPKKVWPKSGNDRFMAFVEKAKTYMPTLKKEFFSGSEYSTKTTGTNHTPEVTPVGEGVYAMTSTGGGQGTTHLVYMLTIPSEVSEVQRDLGLADRGSFVVSLKNPRSSGPANAQLPEGPAYPEEFFDEFRGRSWMPAHPKHIDYANAQVLLIGEDFDSSNNLEPVSKDEKAGDKETPQEELERLEKEDKQRVDKLSGDDTIFTDLGVSRKDYPKVMTTW